MPPPILHNVTSRGTRAAALVALLAALLLGVLAAGSASGVSGDGESDIQCSTLSANHANDQLHLSWTGCAALPEGTKYIYVGMDEAGSQHGPFNPLYSVAGDAWGEAVPLSSLSSGQQSFSALDAVRGLPLNEQRVAYLQGGDFEFQLVAVWPMSEPQSSMIGAVSNVVTVAVSEYKEPWPWWATPPQATPEPEATPEPATTPAPAANPKKPHELQGAEASGTVALTWTPGTNPNFVKQQVKRREPGQPWSILAEVGTDVAAWSDATVESGKTYIYRVFARKANGKGPMTNRVKMVID